MEKLKEYSVTLQLTHDNLRVEGVMAKDDDDAFDKACEMAVRELETSVRLDYLEEH